MNRTVLPPIRTRRISVTAASIKPGSDPAKAARLSPGTRKTLAAISALWLAFGASAHASPPAEAAPAMTMELKGDPLVARGRYLVEQVGLCADCHTPRNEKGAFLREQWLMGSALAMQPMVPMPWAPAAPPIAGLPSMNEAQAMVFLQTGRRPDGSEPRPPMPPYRFSEADASAVVAYLKSLGK
jgi:mono/diheme cytochrome c family protein